MDSPAVASTGTIIKNATTNHIYTRMLWYDNDRRLWENIRQLKEADKLIRDRMAEPHDTLHDVHGDVDRDVLVHLYGYRFWLAYRWICKFWNKLFVKQDSK